MRENVTEPGTETIYRSPILSARVIQHEVSEGSNKTHSGIGSYFTKPSTHGGFYFAGIGWFIGVVGGALSEIPYTIYDDGPRLLNSLHAGSWEGVAYGLMGSVARVALKSSLVSAAGGGIGYAGGTILTGRMMDTFSDLAGVIFGKSRKAVDEENV